MKALSSNYDLTPKAGNQLRYFGWIVAFRPERCRDGCGGFTTWRDPAGIPRHPWECAHG